MKWSIERLRVDVEGAARSAGMGVYDIGSNGKSGELDWLSSEIQERFRFGDENAIYVPSNGGTYDYRGVKITAFRFPFERPGWFFHGKNMKYFGFDGEHPYNLVNSHFVLSRDESGARRFVGIADTRRVIDANTEDFGLMVGEVSGEGVDEFRMGLRPSEPSQGSRNGQIMMFAGKCAEIMDDYKGHSGASARAGPPMPCATP
jgi:hypothetical protein